MKDNYIEIICKIDWDVYHKMNYHIFSRLSYQRKINLKNNPTKIDDYEIVKKLICERI